MKIKYIDNYGEDLLDNDSPYMPRLGDSVHIGNIDEWIVTQVTWNADSNIGVVELTLAEDIPSIREAKQADTSGRLDKMQNAIFEVQRKHDELRKKHRGLKDQVSNVRSHVNQQTQKDKKPS